MAFVRDGGTTSKRSNIEHRKLVCVLMPRADRYMSGDVGEVCVRRPRSRCGTYKASVNIVHSLVSGSCVKGWNAVFRREVKDRGNAGIVMLRPSPSCVLPRHATPSRDPPSVREHAEHEKSAVGERTSLSAVGRESITNLYRVENGNTSGKYARVSRASAMPACFPAAFFFEAKLRQGISNGQHGRFSRA